MVGSTLTRDVNGLDDGATVTDAVWADRIVWPVKIAMMLVGAAMFLTAVASDPGSVGRWVFGIVAVLLPFVLDWAQPPLALARGDDEVLVYRSARFRRRPVERVDVVDVDGLALVGLGLLSDRWSVGDRKLAVPRWYRARLQSWQQDGADRATPSGSRP